MVTTFETTIFSVMMKWGFLMMLVVVSVCAFAQTEQEKLRDVEMQRQANRLRNLERQIDSVALLIDQQQYVAADAKIVNILKTVRSVPSDLTFYLGKTSFYLQKYKQSVDWLNKYIQLKGTSGQFSEEAINLKTKGEVELLKEKQTEAKQAGELLSKDFDIDCGPTGKVACPVCNGSTVIIKKTYLGETYKTCGYCNHTGALSCEDYNKLLKGQLKASTQ
ncbi:MAG: hypothetical protein J0L67_15300 [Cytophagales bacterium]|nr:hypothetical protein [Cytophagales bacterium]